jgi:hypothetical protein
MLGQFAPSAVQPSFHSAGRAPHDLTDLGATEFLVMEQNKAQAVLVAERLQCQLQFFGQIDRFAQGGVGGLLEAKFGCHGMPRALLQDGPATIGGDRQQPRLQRSLPVPAMQTAEGAEKYVLRDILCVLPMPQHAVAQSENGTLKRLDERAQSGRISGQTAPNEFDLVVNHRRSRFPRFCNISVECRILRRRTDFTQVIIPRRAKPGFAEPEFHHPPGKQVRDVQVRDW